jgi:ACS family glucarate transporter-like MFS transporter
MSVTTETPSRTAPTSLIPTRRGSGLLARLRVRWWIFAFMCAFAFIAYVQRQAVTVAAVPMMPELGFSQFQIGLLSWAFVAGYTCCQLLGGVYGQRIGARRCFIIISLISFACAVSMPLASGLMSGMTLFVALMIAQCVMGVSQGPVFPVSAGVFETWFPPPRWSLVLGIQAMFMNFGQAAAPPVLTHLMDAFGWRQALVLASLPALVLIALWAWYGRNTPREHPKVTAEELAELGDAAPVAVTAINWRRLGRLLCNRELLLITISYTCMNYVFYLLLSWSFLYLVQERRFTMLEGGVLASLPGIGAALGAGIGGKLGTMLVVRYGPRWGFRLIPLIALPLSGLLLIAGVRAGNPYWGVAALTAAYAGVELLEGPSWAAMMYVAREDTMAATGALNTGGNLGGLIGIPIVAYLSGHGMWTTAFVLGAVFATVSGLLWFWIDATRRFEAPAAAHG